MMVLLGIILLLQISTLVIGHGNMVLPMAWWDKNQAGWAYNTSDHGYLTRIGCNVLDLPHDTEFAAQQDEKNGPDCMQFWFANNVKIPGEATLPPEMAQPEVTCIGQRGAQFLILQISLRVLVMLGDCHVPTVQLMDYSSSLKNCPSLCQWKCQ